MPRPSRGKPSARRGNSVALHAAGTWGELAKPHASPGRARGRYEMAGHLAQRPPKRSVQERQKPLYILGRFQQARLAHQAHSPSPPNQWGKWRPALKACPPSRICTPAPSSFSALHSTPAAFNAASMRVTRRPRCSVHLTVPRCRGAGQSSGPGPHAPRGARAWGGSLEWRRASLTSDTPPVQQSGSHSMVIRPPSIWASRSAFLNEMPASPYFFRRNWCFSSRSRDERVMFIASARLRIELSKGFRTFTNGTLGFGIR